MFDLSYTQHCYIWISVPGCWSVNLKVIPDGQGGQKGYRLLCQDFKYIFKNNSSSPFILTRKTIFAVSR